MDQDQPTGPVRQQRYHHGDLRSALLAAGEAELAEKGYAGFTLRGTAKRAGVSHAAPAHHFKDAAALLSALAARGFDALLASMRAAEAEAADEPRARLLAAGLGYVRFGLGNPSLLQLMFGADWPIDASPGLIQSADASFDHLVGLVQAYSGAGTPETVANRQTVGLAWSVVHGFTTLAAARRLRFLSEDPAMLEEHLRCMLERAFPGQ